MAINSIHRLEFLDILDCGLRTALGGPNDLTAPLFQRAVEYPGC
jgi:hypothetical protein